MGSCAKEMTMKNTKAQILKEYQRLSEILTNIHRLTTPIDKNGNIVGLKPIVNNSKPSKEVEKPARVQPIGRNANSNRIDILSMLKNMPIRAANNNNNQNNKSTVPQKSNGPSRKDGNADDKRNNQKSDKKPVISLVSDASIPKRAKKVKRGRVDKKPLRRSTRKRTKPVANIEVYGSVLGKR